MISSYKLTLVDKSFNAFHSLDKYTTVYMYNGYVYASHVQKLPQSSLRISTQIQVYTTSILFKVVRRVIFSQYYLSTLKSPSFEYQLN